MIALIRRGILVAGWRHLFTFKKLNKWITACLAESKAHNTAFGPKLGVISKEVFLILITNRYQKMNGWRRGT